MTDRPTFVEAWNAMASWSKERAHREAEVFTRRQPAVTALAMAYLEDQGADAQGLAMQLALALDAVYAGRLGRPPRQVGQRDVERALDEAERAFLELGEMEPELALRRMLHRRETAAPEVLADVLDAIMTHAEDEPAIRKSIGPLFVAVKAAMLAYERANGLRAQASSLAAAREARGGASLVKVGRNDPCPCGSGAKFKRCCGARPAAGAPPPVGDTAAERHFLAYLNVAKRVLLFQQRFDGKDAPWLRRQNRDFERRFRPGEDDGTPDSLHVGWLLFDVRLPAAGRTVGELFLAREGGRLAEGDRGRLHDLCASYTTFHEVTALLPGEGRKRLREVVTGIEWTARDVEDSEARNGRVGDVWLCRLVGPRDDAVTFMTPIVYPGDRRDDIERLLRHLLRDEPPERIGDVMKREVPFLAEFTIASRQPAPALPALSNMDGDPLLPTTLVYDVDSVAAALATLGDLEPDGPSAVERAADGTVVRATIRWVRDTPGRPLENVLAGTLRLEPGRLTVEVNSRERAAAAGRLIEERLGATARLRATKHEPLETALREAAADPGREEKTRAAAEEQARLMAEHPELGQALLEWTTDYHRRWLDMPIPALGGQTPRAAVQTEDGRARVRALVDDLERMESRRPPHTPRMDVGWMRRELGIE